MAFLEHFSVCHAPFRGRISFCLGAWGLEVGLREGQTVVKL